MDEEGVDRDDDNEEEDDEENEGDEEDGDEEGSPTRRNDDPNACVTRRSNRVTSRGRTRATSIDNSHETPRRRLRNRTVCNPSSITRAIRAAVAQEKLEYYNSEFRKRDIQRYHFGDRM